MYALNLDTDGRILSATFDGFATEGMPIVEELPEGNINDYLYKELEVEETEGIENEEVSDAEGAENVEQVKQYEYIYDPIPEVEPVIEPTQLDIIESQVFYTAMMTDTLLESEE
jgi:hypothetical protein